MHIVQHPTLPKATRAVEDPAPWVEQGWVLLEGQDAEQAAHDLDPSVPVKPAGNASQEAWLEYALNQPNADEAFFRGMTRDQLRDHFAG
ncbi:MAG TPA: hypothetical protein VIQ11_12980 [Mycobacterium sp.]